MEQWIQKIKETYTKMVQSKLWEEASLDGPNSSSVPELPQETIKELVRQGWKHPVHNPPRPSGARSGGWGNRGYFIDEPHPEHKGWYVTKGPYSGD